jgi:putative NIF3 family GTP cyclohydrolase 1 type 2
MNRVSRREFVTLSAAGAVAAPFLLDSAPLGTAAPSAQEIVDLIKKHVGMEWKAATVDTFKAGDPSTVVTGIVTTSLATIDVMRQAVKAGANMVITSGPTFYSRADSPTPPAGRDREAAPLPYADPVFTAKSEFIKTNKLVVWRFSDHWRLRTPDPFAQGLTDALGWAKYRASSDSGLVTVPAITLDALVAQMKTQLNARGGMRIIGNPQTRVQKIGVLPGSVPIQAVLTILPQVDAIVAGEVREWEGAEYARDSVTAGLDKGLILIGRTLSEDTGMKVCAQWLETIAPETPCRWIPVGDPYWRPTT